MLVFTLRELMPMVYNDWLDSSYNITEVLQLTIPMHFYASFACIYSYCTNKFTYDLVYTLHHLGFL